MTPFLFHTVLSFTDQHYPLIRATVPTRKTFFQDARARPPPPFTQLAGPPAFHDARAGDRSLRQTHLTGSAPPRSSVPRRGEPLGHHQGAPADLTSPETPHNRRRRHRVGSRSLRHGSRSGFLPVPRHTPSPQPAQHQSQNENCRWCRAADCSFGSSR